MGCSSCRKPPRIVRKPPSVVSPSVGKPTQESRRSESERAKITGLKYVPKG